MASAIRGLLIAALLVGMFIAVVESESQNLKLGLIRVTAQDTFSLVVQSDDNSTKEFCFAYQADLFTLPTKPEDKYYTLYDATAIDVCEGHPPVNLTGNNTLMLFQQKGNCSLLEYIEFVHASKGAGFFVNNMTKEAVNDSLTLSIFGSVRNDTITELKKYMEWRKDTVVQVFTFEDVFFGASIIFLWLTACLCVAIGSLTGPYQDLQSTSSRQQILEGSSTSSGEPKNFQVNFTVTLVLTLVVFITATLLLLYFFYNYLVYFFMAIFCFASGRAVFEILSQIAHVFKFDACMPRIRGCGLHRIFLAAIGITLPIIWVIFRKSDSIWILQDLLGVCFCIHIIQTLRIPNLKICTVLLSLLFFYDVFFVFITPYITSDGKSVMVEVATGGQSGESLPLLVKFPRTVGHSACTMQSYSLLGYGDIIVPGFLVCFAHSFDIIRGDKLRPYFIITMIGYGVGLALAFVALFISQTGQPALLYIVPTTLLAISITGFCRKQLRELWRGSITITEVEP